MLQPLQVYITECCTCL